MVAVVAGILSTSLSDDTHSYELLTYPVLGAVLYAWTLVCSLKGNDTTQLVLLEH
jgi:hypothetical protein